MRVRSVRFETGGFLNRITYENIEEPTIYNNFHNVLHIYLVHIYSTSCHRISEIFSHFFKILYMPPVVRATTSPNLAVGQGLPKSFIRKWSNSHAGPFSRLAS